jgi:hypothetical protein
VLVDPYTDLKAALIDALERIDAESIFLAGRRALISDALRSLQGKNARRGHNPDDQDQAE